MYSKIPKITNSKYAQNENANQETENEGIFELGDINPLLTLH